MFLINVTWQYIHVNERIKFLLENFLMSQSANEQVTKYTTVNIKVNVLRFLYFNYS